MVNKNNDWHRERRVGEAVKAGIKCFCGSEAYRDILEVTMNCETFPRVHRIFCPNCGLQMRSPAWNDDDFIVRQWRDISDLHQHRKAQEPRVMTAEEWREWKRKPLSQRDPVYYVDNKGVCSWIAPNDQLFIYATPELGYGVLFVCWTSRPTDEQREAVPWN